MKQHQTTINKSTLVFPQDNHTLVARGKDKHARHSSGGEFSTQTHGKPDGTQILMKCFTWVHMATSEIAEFATLLTPRGTAQVQSIISIQPSRKVQDYSSSIVL